MQSKWVIFTHYFSTPLEQHFLAMFCIRPVVILRQQLLYHFGNFHHEQRGIQATEKESIFYSR